MFGINSAFEIFQNAIAEILTGLDGCKNISDDIIVHGKDQKQHDNNLRAVLKRLTAQNTFVSKRQMYILPIAGVLLWSYLQCSRYQS